MQATRLLSLSALTLLVLGGAPRPVDPATPQRLGGETRYLTHVSTDKPIYKEGEIVYVRGVVLEARSRTPVGNGRSGTIIVKGPKGEVVTQAQSALVDGAFGFSWRVPEGQAGGEYTVVAHGGPGFAPGERKFDVRVYRAPRLKSQITFARDGYGEGDTVRATLETARAEGGAPTGARITAVARVDGVDVASAPCSLDAKGRCTVALKLPATIERGEGTVAFTIEDGGVVETATKTIPILVRAFDVDVFPEGGELVAGVPSRVYVEARTPSRKPADVAAVITDRKGAVVASFRTEHEGRGRFTFTPKRGEAYTLRVTEPASVKKTVPLPAVVNQGATLTTAADVISANQPARVTVHLAGVSGASVVLHQRGVELSRAPVSDTGPQGLAVSLDAKDAEGVLVATVLAKDGAPLAERLLFREAAKTLRIELKADRERYVPGAPVKLTVRTLLDGRPAPAFVGLTVTDDSVLELIEKREQAPSLPVMAYLESDVKDLSDAHVYLDPANPKAKLAVDLLLGTQGWRRFASVNVEAFVSRAQDAARRVLALYTPPTRDRFDGFSGGGIGGHPGLPPPRPASPKLAVRKADARPPDAVEPLPAPSPQRPAPRPAPAAEAAPPRPAPPAAVIPLAAPPPPVMERKRAFKEEMAEERFALVTVREFVHRVRPNRQPNDRLDFTETLFWAAALKTDERGLATVEFGTSDAVTSFRASADGYTAGGVLGSAQSKLEVVKPFYVEPKLPLEVTEGDVVRLPIAFVNGTREPLAKVTLGLETKADVRFTPPAAFGLGADERARRVVELTVGPRSRTTELTLTAGAGGYSDVVTRPLAIAPKGFPAEQSGGGLLEANGRARFAVTMPADTVPGSVKTSIVVYPSPAGNLSSALRRMVREPSGCFEQTSSIAYPMTMALQYFQSHTGAEPAVVQDAQEKLERGYKRLVGFECKQGGYEWFGEDPGHEALTAYGLLEFADMAKVRHVDPTMVARTRAWLLKQRDGKGGFERKRRALHTWVEDKDTSDAYITWALLEAGEKGLGPEVARVKEAGRASANSYVVALAANVAAMTGDEATAKLLLGKLAERHGPDGFVSGATQSIVGSAGRSLLVETTALATLGWLRLSAKPGASNPFWANVERAMKGLAEASKDGGYGATQSTVLALRCVLAYDAVVSAKRSPGAVRLFVDGKPLGPPVTYDGSTQGALEFPDAPELLSPGAHSLELVQEGGGRLPWTMAVFSHRVQPESSPETKVGLEVKLTRASGMAEGDLVEAEARVTNLTDEALPTTVAIVGLPGGLEPRVDQLKELVKAKTIDAWEVRGRDVVLYWRGMTPKQQVRVPVSLVAAVPGRYVGPASRAYLYYGDEHKAWVAGLSADIAPAQR
jgi:hypothetical protein